MRNSYAAPPDHDNPSRGARSQADGPAPERTGRRLLIVEDNWLVAIDMEAALIDAGYDVIGIAVSANEAVALCDAQRPDLVLMDIRLQGGSDGIAAAMEIRTRFGITSIFVSAHDDAGTRARAVAAQPLGWIVKPVSSADLVLRLAALKNPRH